MAGLVGALPRPAWGAVVGMLSSFERGPESTRRTTVLELRRTCKALAELVAAGCVGGAGRLGMLNVAAQLEAAPTAGLGRALVVLAWMPFLPTALEEQEALARALMLAVERGHMVQFMASTYECSPGVTRMIEAALIEASRNRRLLLANLGRGASLGWRVDAMSQLSAVMLWFPKRETIAKLVGAGVLQRVDLRHGEWADLSILSSLREVKLYNCAVEDLCPVSGVPSLVVTECDRITTLPAMRNDVLEVSSCDSLGDVSGLARGRVGRLELRFSRDVKDVSAIGAMQPPPRTVVLSYMDEVQDVSMLAGIHRLEVIRCRILDKAATLAALEGKVGTIRWE